MRGFRANRSVGRSVASAVCVIGLVLTACSDDDERSSADREFDDEFADGFDHQSAVDSSGDSGEDGMAQQGGIPDTDTEEILEELLEGGFCDPADVDDMGPVTAMHFVVQGQIQPPCYVGDGNSNSGAVGADGDSRLLSAWNALADITPTSLIADVSLLAGYECDGCDALAFVSALDDRASFFLMAVDVLAADADQNELLVTMQHELSHVFTQIPDEQLDVGGDGDACPTFHNGSGCFVAGSYMAEWVAAFWPDGLLAQLPADGSTSSDEDSDARCLADPGYAGPYAASSPEEDFAETFAAYVFDIDLPAALDDKLGFFSAYPEFVEVRDNAASAGLGELPYEFEACG